MGVAAVMELQSSGAAPALVLDPVPRGRGQQICQQIFHIRKFVKNLSNFSKIFTNFASNLAFFSIFQNLQDFAELCNNAANYAEFSENFQKKFKEFVKL